MLGGWSAERKDGALQSWNPNLKVVNATATIKLVEASQRLNNNRWRHREEDEEEESNRGEERSEEGEEVA